MKYLSALGWSTSWGSGRPTAPATPPAGARGASFSTSWGSGRGVRGAGLVIAVAAGLTCAVVPGAASTAAYRSAAPSARSLPFTSARTLASAVTTDAIGDTGPGDPDQGIRSSVAAVTGALNFPGQGAGQTVAVLDSGVDPVPALAGRVIQGPNFTADADSDVYGHGTFVAGLIAGNGLDANGNQTAIVGVAPQAQILAIKVVDDSGAATVGSLADGLEWLLIHHAEYDVTVANLSVGESDVDTTFANNALDALVEALWDSGVTVVVSAGNDGGQVDHAPADDPTVLTVGAADDTDGPATLAPFSDQGPTEDGIAKPELTADGVHVQAVLPTGSVLAGEQVVTDLPAGYGQLSGTSMSAAVVSGLVADLQSSRPNLSPTQVKAALMASAGWGLRQPRLRDSLRDSYFGSAYGGGFGGGQGGSGGYSSGYSPPAPSPLLASLAQAMLNADPRAAATVGQAGQVASQVVWSEVVWSDVVWSDVVWSDVVWSDVVWSDVVWSDVVWSDVVWSDTDGTNS